VYVFSLKNEDKEESRHPIGDEYQNLDYSFIAEEEGEVKSRDSSFDDEPMVHESSFLVKVQCYNQPSVSRI
jgi:hypothetical protein